nr:immunoglobulin heavy chain junction region [Mus musculus]MBK4184147.1 immunoglobulin heavy chain junction region [Mus musculus]MBK4184152.1 immunoglobulin heavy chain junction region [Mus musculus]
CARGDGFFDYW